MSVIALSVAIAAAALALGVAAWSWVVMDRADEELRSLIGFEGQFFENGSSVLTSIRAGVSRANSFL